MIFQQFYSFMETTLVTIQTKMSGSKCLTLRPNEDMVLYDRKPDANQKFQIVKADLGQVYFRCQSSSNVITLKEEVEKDGVRFSSAPYEKKPSQHFRIQEISPQSNQYLIYTFCGKVLDVCECSKKNNTVIHQWVFNGEANQVWTLQKA